MMHYGKHYITHRRCDEPMRRSKEKGLTPFLTPWHCTGNCSTCICCIEMNENGDEKHVSFGSKEKT